MGLTFFLIISCDDETIRTSFLNALRREEFSSWESVPNGSGFNSLTTSTAGTKLQISANDEAKGKNVKILVHDGIPFFTLMYYNLTK